MSASEIHPLDNPFCFFVPIFDLETCRRGRCGSHLSYFPQIEPLISREFPRAVFEPGMRRSRRVRAGDVRILVGFRNSRNEVHIVFYGAEELLTPLFDQLA